MEASAFWNLSTVVKNDIVALCPITRILGVTLFEMILGVQVPCRIRLSPVLGNKKILWKLKKFHIMTNLDERIQNKGTSVKLYYNF